MSAVAFETVTEPVSDDLPCGPDLDLEGDADFMNFMARSEGLLPQSFFTVNDDGVSVPFDRTQIAYADEAKTIARFLGESRDLRLLTILAKFAILSRDLATFAGSLDAIARLLSERWTDVHPRGEDGDFTLRMVTLQTLDDMPTVVLPVQYAPLVMGRRTGNVTFRNVQVALGEVQKRNGEDGIELSTIDSAVSDTDLATLVALRDRLALACAAVAAIQRVWIEQAGYDQALSFPRLAPILTRIERWLNEAVARRDPSAQRPDDTAAEAPSGAGPAAAAPVAVAGSFASAGEAAKALAAAVDYFRRSEPASPTLLLAAQAQDLVGKSLHQILTALMPERAEYARFALGGDIPLNLPLQRLSELPGLSGDGGVDSGSTDEGASDSWGSSSWDTPAEEGEAADGADEAAADVTPDPQPPARPPASAASRQEALALLSAVARHFRQHEPASPIPLLLDRAAGYASKDFAALLKELMPPQE